MKPYMVGKSLLDVGCAEGYFMWRFIKDGGWEACGVEINDSQVLFVNQLAALKDMNVIALKHIPERKFDIAIYLDLYGHDEKSVDYLDEIYPKASLLFISQSGSLGDGRHEKMINHINRLGGKPTIIHNGYNGRQIVMVNK